MKENPSNYIISAYLMKKKKKFIVFKNFLLCKISNIHKSGKNNVLSPDIPITHEQCYYHILFLKNINFYYERSHFSVHLVFQRSLICTCLTNYAAIVCLNPFIPESPACSTVLGTQTFIFSNLILSTFSMLGTVLGGIYEV